MRGAYFAGAATETPRALVFSMARTTSHDALVSSTEDWKSSVHLLQGATPRRSALMVPLTKDELAKRMVTPAGFEPAISTLKGSRPWPG